MIDRDLAVLYSVDTKRINEQARRNIERFPDRFRFQLSDEETSQLVAFCDRFKSLKHSTVNPFAYTEQGVAMLATVLKSDKAVFFDGQIFDAYVFASELIRSAKISITLIDNYVDESVLLLLSKRDAGVAAKIITRQITQGLAADLSRHNQQYSSVVVTESPRFHDRFLIIDDAVYHIGASLKDLGKKFPYNYSALRAPLKCPFTPFGFQIGINIARTLEVKSSFRIG